MNAAEAIAQYRKSATALRRIRCWAGSPERTKKAARGHEQRMNEALKALRGMNLHEVENRLRAERRLLDSAAHYGDDYDPSGASCDRGKAKQHQYKIRQLIRGH